MRQITTVFFVVILGIFALVVMCDSQDPLTEGSTDSPLTASSPIFNHYRTSITSPSMSVISTTARNDELNSHENISKRLIFNTMVENSQAIVTTLANKFKDSSDEESRLEVTSTATGNGFAVNEQRLTDAEPETDSVTGIIITTNLTPAANISNISAQNQVTHRSFEIIPNVDVNLRTTDIVITDDNYTINSDMNKTVTMYLNATICHYACLITDLTTVTDNVTSSNISVDTIYYNETFSPSFYSETTVRHLLGMTTTVTATTATTTAENSNSTGNYSIITDSTTESPYQNVQDPEVCKKCQSRQLQERPLTLSKKTLYYIKATAQVWRYCPPILFFIGTVGNVLSTAVMMRRSLRSSITSFFLVILAVVDTFMLWNGLMRHYLRVIHDIDVRSYSKAVCRLHIFLTYWGGQFSAWILVCMTTERFFAIFSPHKSKQYVTKLSCAIVVGVVGILLAGLNGHFFRIQHLILYQETTYCVTKNEYEHFIEKIWPWIDFAFFSFIPFGILVLGNMGIIIRIAHSNYVRKHSMKQNTGEVKMTSMTAILLTVSFMFFLTTAPISIYLVLQEKFNRDPTDETLALNSLWWAIVVNVNYINHACNFFLYCISGPRFRRELRGIFSMHRKIYPITVTQTLEHSGKTPTVVIPPTAASNV